jgi:hypothetical protein
MVKLILQPSTADALKNKHTLGKQAKNNDEIKLKSESEGIQVYTNLLSNG